jgi:hypothetical protein
MPSKMLSAILLILCTFLSGLIGHYVFSDLHCAVIAIGPASRTGDSFANKTVAEA